MKANERVRDELIERRLLMLRFENSLSQALSERLTALRREVLDRVISTGAQRRLTQRGVASLATFVKQRVESEVATYLAELRLQLPELYEVEAESTQEAISVALASALKGRDVHESVVSAEKDSAAKEATTTDLDVVTDEVIASVSRPIVSAIKGARLDALRESLTVGADESLPVSSALQTGGLIGAALTAKAALVAKGFDRAETTLDSVSRTKVQQTVVMAQSRVYQANAHLVHGETFTTFLDLSVCPLCARWHGVTFWNEKPEGGYDERNRRRSEKSLAVIPIHFGCRCAYVAVLRRAADLVEDPTPEELRALDGQPAKMGSFDEWLRDMPSGAAIENLGPGRYELWRSGVKIKDMVSDGRVLTLSELRERLRLRRLA